LTSIEAASTTWPSIPLGFQKPMQPKAVKAGFLDDNDPASPSAAFLRFRLEPVQKHQQGRRIPCRDRVLAALLAQRRIHANQPCRPAEFQGDKHNALIVATFLVN
jgi:hypothetical protein